MLTCLHYDWCQCSSISQTNVNKKSAAIFHILRSVFLYLMMCLYVYSVWFSSLGSCAAKQVRGSISRQIALLIQYEVVQWQVILFLRKSANNQRHTVVKCWATRDVTSFTLTTGHHPERECLVFRQIACGTEYYNNYSTRCSMHCIIKRKGFLATFTRNLKVNKVNGIHGKFVWPSKFSF